MDSERIDWWLVAKIIGIGIVGLVVFLAVFLGPILLLMWSPALGIIAYLSVFVFGLPLMTNKPLTKRSYIKRLPYTFAGTIAFFGSMVLLIRLTILYPNTTIYAMMGLLILMTLATIPFMVYVAYKDVKKKEKKVSK